MKYFHVITILILFITGCSPAQIGFLDTRNARYIPDTAVFKSVLDPGNFEDARRIQFEIPWESSGIQGIDGTNPKEYKIVRVDCDVASLHATGQFYLSNIYGRIALPYNHTVPPGRYVFSVEISNEKGRNSDVMEKALTVIIK